jgi:hypothetical protein
MVRLLVAGISPRRPGFECRSVHVRLVDKEALGHGFLRLLRWSPVSIIPSILHTQLHLYEQPYILLRGASAVVVCWYADHT